MLMLEENSTVEPLLTDPPRSGQPLSNGHTQKHRLVLACYQCKTNLREATASLLRTTDTSWQSSD